MRHYEFMKEDLSVPELKKEITQKISNIDDFNLLDRIYQVLSHKDVKGKIEQALSFTTQDSNLGDTDTIINDMMTSIASIPGTSAEKLAFVDTLEAGKAVDTDALQMASATFDQIFPMNFAQDFFIANANFGRGIRMKGPGEFALAIMAPDISLAEKGDLEIKGKHVEVKAAGKTGAAGRLGEVGPAPKEKIVSTLRETADKHMKTPEQIQFFEEAFEAVISKSLTISIQSLHKLFEGNPKAVADCVASTLSLTFPEPMSKAIGKAAARDPSGALAEMEYMKQNFEWYKKRDGFDSLLAVWFTGKKVYNFASGEEFAALRASGFLGAASVSFIPSKPNEVYAQVNFTKKK
jgi:hypothetical protein